MTVEGRGRSVRRKRGALPLAGILWLASCTGQPPTPSTSPRPSASEAATATPSAGEPDASELACDRNGYPCTFAEVDAAVQERQAQYVRHINSIISSGSYAEALAWIREQDGVIDADAGEFELSFRLAGGRPVVVSEILEDADPPESAGVPGMLLASASMSRGVPVADREPGFDIVGEGIAREHPQNLKRALFLDPLSNDKNSGFRLGVRELQKIHDYDHPDGISYLPAAKVTPDSFTGWDAFDAVFVATHGGLRGGSWLLTGLYEEVPANASDEEMVETCVWLMGEEWVGEIGLDCVHVAHNNKQYIGIAVFGDFFWEAYGPPVGPSSGLAKTIVYIGGCNGLRMTEIASALAGSTSAFIGWTAVTQSPWWEGATLNLLKGLLEGRTVEYAVSLLCESDIGCIVDETGAEFGIHDNGSAPRVLRLYDLPTLRDPRSPSSSLGDGAKLGIRGIAGDGEPDQLQITVDLIGVVHPNPGQGSGDLGPPADLYELRFLLGDEERDIGVDNLGEKTHPTADVTQLGPSSYRYTYLADLGFDVDPGGYETSLKVVVELPEGGISDYEVDVTLIQRTGATVTVGDQTWEFGLSTAFGLDGCIADTDAQITASGTIDGDLEGPTLWADLRPGSWHLEVNDPAGDRNWLAAAERSHMTTLHLVPDGHSQVDELTIEDGRAWGTATFIETNAFIEADWTNTAYPLPVTGSFEIRCR